MDLHAPGVRKFEPWPCPTCGYVMDAASHLTEDGSMPGDGDYSVCLKCGEAFVMSNDRWRLPTDDELIALSLDDKKQISRVQILVREINAAGLGPKDPQ